MMCSVLLSTIAWTDVVDFSHGRLVWMADKVGVEFNTLVVLLALSCVGVVAGAVGSFAVLRRRALTGDALAHASLPGLCIAFMLAGERSVPLMLAGAFVSGLIGVSLIVALRRWTRVKEDAAIGIILSVFFGAGIVLSGVIQHEFPAGNKAGLDSYILGKATGIQVADLLIMGAVTLGCVTTIALAFKEFRLITFDAAFARSQGWPVGAIDLVLMAMVALVVVIGLPSVGVALIAALLIIPGASARFWTESLGKMTLLATLFGAVIGLVGAALSASFSHFSTGPVVVLTGSALFLASALFAPRRGAIARRISDRRFARDVGLQRLLAELYEVELSTAASDAAAARHATGGSAWQQDWNPRELARVMRAARAEGLVAQTGAAGDWRLTTLGRQRAITAARNRLLWQTLLTEYPEIAVGAADPMHGVADEYVSPTLRKELEMKLRAASLWPLDAEATGAKTAKTSQAVAP
jgi:manganese/zinc/iron transport system permease protein